MKKRIAVLASGGGTDLQSILDGCESGEIDGKVVAVVANNADAHALERARKHGAAAVYLDHRRKPREEYEMEISAELDRHDPDLIVLAGWLRMLTKYFPVAVRRSVTVLTVPANRRCSLVFTAPILGNVTIFASKLTLTRCGN